MASSAAEIGGPTSKKNSLPDVRRIAQTLRSTGAPAVTVDALMTAVTRVETEFAQANAEVERATAHAEAADARSAQMRELVQKARDAAEAVQAELEKMSAPVNQYGIVVRKFEDGTVDIFSSGRKIRVNASKEIDQESLQYGREVRLNENMNIVEILDFSDYGTVSTVKEVLDGGTRVLMVSQTDQEVVLKLADPLLHLATPLKAGDSLMVDERTGFAYELVPKSEVNDLQLEEVPDITYDNIGGLAQQIAEIRDAVELPFLHPELFKEYELRPPKGVLLYGPPGCGKTLIAKAVANSLAQEAKNKGGSGKAYFLNIKGPELLNKYVGETERHIRLLFQRARETASPTTPVIIFFDEMDSIFRVRGSGISSDVENTIVPQLLAELDGVESLENVIVIGATNREDTIDPAILRPGRLDKKIKIARPDEVASRDIFTKYVKAGLPLHADDLSANGGDRERTAASMVAKVVDEIYSQSDDHKFLEVTYQSGEKEDLYYKDFNSGSMIESIVDRAKKMAIKDFLETGVGGIKTSHLVAACIEEFRENEDLPNTTNPDDWARIAGKKGEKIIGIRPLRGYAAPEAQTSRKIDSVGNTGQYL